MTYETRSDQALLYRLSGDRNPLHSDPAFAAFGGFDRPILHGLCTYGFTGRGLLHLLCGSDPGRFRSMEGRFSSPVLPAVVQTLGSIVVTASFAPATLGAQASSFTITSDAANTPDVTVDLSGTGGTNISVSPLSIDFGTVPVGQSAGPVPVTIRGVATRIGGSLGSPHANELAAGVSRALGARGALRADVVYRVIDDDVPAGDQEQPRMALEKEACGVRQRLLSGEGTEARHGEEQSVYHRYARIDRRGCRGMSMVHGSCPTRQHRHRLSSGSSAGIRFASRSGTLTT